MKTAITIITLAIAAWHYSSNEYRRGYMDGYQQKQIENLPAPGVERSKRPNPELVTKTGRG